VAKQLRGQAQLQVLHRARVRHYGRLRVPVYVGTVASCAQLCGQGCDGCRAGQQLWEQRELYRLAGTRFRNVLAAGKAV